MIDRIWVPLGSKDLQLTCFQQRAASDSGPRPIFDLPTSTPYFPFIRESNL